MTEFQQDVPLLYPNGTQVAAKITVSENEVRDGIELHLRSEQGLQVSAFSERSVFDATRKIRLQLEQNNILLFCFAADETVYPSPMQESMGLNCLAYRHRLGNQALSSDIVNIFDSEPSIQPVSVERQEQFHQRWLDSL
ncbi:hypothetical protein OOT46_30265 [Aquabacterium sp. A7-Y]|uniref:hypothetical protein n=1 Tax=Aquabacterium sp. A7-Y TaxID=1349605 RepID=UPI00223D6178|nr:hypothetical protein [Aquabacterium sp. A7-Y]MCW7542083.1 hypothetical protein [Aquabacterium sp. A7-Y]